MLYPPPPPPPPPPQQQQQQFLALLGVQHPFSDHVNHVNFVSMKSPHFATPISQRSPAPIHPRLLWDRSKCRPAVASTCHCAQTPPRKSRPTIPDLGVVGDGGCSGKNGQKTMVLSGNSMGPRVDGSCFVFFFMNMVILWGCPHVQAHHIIRWPLPCSAAHIFLKALPAEC